LRLGLPIALFQIGKPLFVYGIGIGVKRHDAGVGEGLDEEHWRREDVGAKVPDQLLLAIERATIADVVHPDPGQQQDCGNQRPKRHCPPTRHFLDRHLAHRLTHRFHRFDPC